jgi:hypothetical protein
MERATVRSNASHRLTFARRLSRPRRADRVPALRLAGRYSLAGLIERFGPSAALPDVLMDLAACERRKDFTQPCGVRLGGVDLASARARKPFVKFQQQRSEKPFG